MIKTRDLFKEHTTCAYGSCESEVLAIAIYVSRDEYSARFCSYMHLSLWAEQKFSEKEVPRIKKLSA